jgi:hypothetical protein|tara:strand:- start:71 stop:202 length:132 start_codon:yes stop_codon:yes gene_type:complete
MNQGYTYVPKPTGFEKFSKEKARVHKKNKKQRMKLLRLTTPDW